MNINQRSIPMVRMYLMSKQQDLYYIKLVRGEYYIYTRTNNIFIDIASTASEAQALINSLVDDCNHDIDNGWD